MILFRNRLPIARQYLEVFRESFDCGTEPWEVEVSSWLKTPEGGGADLNRENQFWLYATDEGDLVGFGSLGEAWTRYPTAKDPRIQVSVIPMLGVDKRFWGQPPGPREQRFSALILDDLIGEAKKRNTENRLLILFVNEKNTRAVKL